MITSPHADGMRRERPGAVFEVLHEPRRLYADAWSVDLEITPGRPVRPADLTADPATRGLSKAPVTARTPIDHTERDAAEALFDLIGLLGAPALAAAVTDALGQQVLTVTDIAAGNADGGAPLGGVGGVGLELKRPGYPPSTLRRQARRQLDYRDTHHTDDAAAPHLVWLCGDTLPEDLFGTASAVHALDPATFTDALLRHCPSAARGQARRLADTVVRNLASPIGSGHRTRMPEGWPDGVTRTVMTLAAVELAGQPAVLANGNELAIAPWINQRAGRDYLAEVAPLLVSPERLFPVESLFTAAWRDGVLTRPPTRVDVPLRLLEGITLNGTTHWLLPRPVMRDLFRRLDLPVHAGRYPIEAFHRNDTGHSNLYAAAAVIRWMISHNIGTDACNALADIHAGVKS